MCMSVDRMSKTFANREKTNFKVALPTTNPALTGQVTNRVRLLRGVQPSHKTEVTRLGYKCVFLSARNAQTKR
jgi:hypothetical protein